MKDLAQNICHFQGRYQLAKIYLILPFLEDRQIKITTNFLYRNKMLKQAYLLIFKVSLRFATIMKCATQRSASPIYHDPISTVGVGFADQKLSGGFT